MSGCLPDETLVLVQAGEGMEADREHLAACQACGARYQRLIQDLELIGQALDGAPPPRARRLPAPWRSWVPAAAGVAVAGALVGGLWFGKAPRPVILLEPSSADTAPVLQLVSATLFSAIETGPFAVADMARLHDLGAAPEGEPSCEWAQAFSPGCEDSWTQDDLVDLAAGDA